MKYQLHVSVIIAILLLFSGCGSKSTSVPNNSPAVHKATMKPYNINGKTYYPTMVSKGDTFSGIASWYGPDFHGKKTSNGETYNMHAMTAAHKTFPMNTIVQVKNTRNNKKVIVRINDRGPFVANRIIDLSYAAAKAIDMANAGTAPVVVEVIGFDGNANIIAQNQVENLPKTNVILSDFDVQIGAFRKQSGAQLYSKMYNDKKSKYYKAIVQEGILDGAKIYRVWVRGFRGEDEARDFIKNSEYEGAFIVREK